MLRVVHEQGWQQHHLVGPRLRIEISIQLVALRVRSRHRAPGSASRWRPGASVKVAWACSPFARQAGRHLREVEVGDERHEARPISSLAEGVPVQLRGSAGPAAPFSSSGPLRLQHDRHRHRDLAPSARRDRQHRERDLARTGVLRDHLGRLEAARQRETRRVIGTLEVAAAMRHARAFVLTMTRSLWKRPGGVLSGSNASR